MPTNISLIRSGISTTLTACGPFDSTQVSACDYRILEQNSACAIVFHYEGEESEDITYRGNDMEVTEWTTMRFVGECYINFTGDPKTFLANVYQARDDIKGAIRKDTSLQSSACFGWVNAFSYNIEEGYEMAGRDWGVLRFVITVRDM